MGLGDDMMDDIEKPVGVGSKMSLGNVSKGVKKTPLRMLVSGEGGTGKTSLACGADNAIVIDVEGGSHQQNVDRFPQPDCWDDITSAINILRREDHAYKTVIIDSLDFAESMCFAETCRRNNWGSIETPGFGKGYAQAREVWRSDLLDNLDALQAEKGVNVVLIAHTIVANISNPDGSDYTAHKLKLDKKIGPMSYEWVDICAYLAYEPVVDKEARKVRAKRHVMKFAPGAAHDAKCRYVGMPDVLEMPDNPKDNWKTFRAALIDTMKA